MGVPAGLDPDLLRAFVLIAEEGSFTRAARLVGRTQSAVSMQVQRLEGLLGQTLLERGRGGAVRPTVHGQRLLGEARELLALHDRIWRGFRTPTVQGTVRLGTPDDYALRYLPQILTRFAAAHPAVDVEVLCLPVRGSGAAAGSRRPRSVAGVGIPRHRRLAGRRAAAARPARLDHLGDATTRTGATRCRWRSATRGATRRARPAAPGADRRWRRWRRPGCATASPTAPRRRPAPWRRCWRDWR